MIPVLKLKSLGDSIPRVGTSLLFKLPLCASPNTRSTGRVDF